MSDTGAQDIMDKSRISVRLDPEMRCRLEQEVNATGKRESELVRAALSVYLRRRRRAETCLELAQRHGIIGCGKGLPADLSTSRKHFEGFGK
jgi:Arc/MetJ-type ribon-helix-helix transcriptional regulator